MDVIATENFAYPFCVSKQFFERMQKFTTSWLEKDAVTPGLLRGDNHFNKPYVEKLRTRLQNNCNETIHNNYQGHNIAEKMSKNITSSKMITVEVKVTTV